MMTVLFFLLLILAVAPLWAWMVLRLWPLSPPGARVAFVGVLPAYCWGYYLWRGKHDALRVVMIANIAALALLLAVGYKALADNREKSAMAVTKSRSSAEWERWCRENNDATYDPVLGTCVENTREEALSRIESKDILGRLTRHMVKHGVKSEIDASATAAAMHPELLTEEIAKVTAFYFLPLSMSQPEISILLCVSSAACASFAESSADRGKVQVLRNAELLLVLPAELPDDARLTQLKQAFTSFKGG